MNSFREHRHRFDEVDFEFAGMSVEATDPVLREDIVKRIGSLSETVLQLAETNLQGGMVWRLPRIKRLFAKASEPQITEIRRTSHGIELEKASSQQIVNIERTPSDYSRGRHGPSYIIQIVTPDQADTGELRHFGIKCHDTKPIALTCDTLDHPQTTLFQSLEDFMSPVDVAVADLPMARVINQGLVDMQKALKNTRP